eukprot:841082_1
MGQGQSEYKINYQKLFSNVTMGQGQSEYKIDYQECDLMDKERLKCMKNRPFTGDDCRLISESYAFCMSHGMSRERFARNERLKKAKEEEES